MAYPSPASSGANVPCALVAQGRLPRGAQLRFLRRHAVKQCLEIQLCCRLLDVRGPCMHRCSKQDEAPALHAPCAHVEFVGGGAGGLAHNARPAAHRRGRVPSINGVGCRKGVPVADGPPLRQQCRHCRAGRGGGAAGIQGGETSQTISAVGIADAVPNENNIMATYLLPERTGSGSE